jgi:hypothetical protein
LTTELRRALVPSLLILLAVLAIGIVTMGNRSSLARHEWGIDTIILVRRVQWLLVLASLVSCIVLLILVIANRRPVSWLVGLVPVLILFTARFGGTHSSAALVCDLPHFTDAFDAAAPRDDDWIVGLTFEGQTYAFPYRALNLTPIVAVTDYSKRMLLVFSPRANRAIAVSITRDLRPRALEVVSEPNDALLLYDRRYGQFIGSITAQTIGGEVPFGFGDRIEVTKCAWSAWRALHPDTRVMLPRSNASRAPAAPQAPRMTPATLPIAMLETDPPVAIESQIQLIEPLNLIVGELRVLIVRDPVTGSLRAFERRVNQDLFPTFRFHRDPRRPDRLVLLDSDTDSTWSLTGRAIDGAAKGERLRELPLEDGLWLGVMQFWYPQLHLIKTAS